MNSDFNPLRRAWTDIKSELQRRWRGFGRSEVSSWNRDEQANPEIRKQRKQVEPEENSSHPI